jgi:hypothetical protein
MTMPKYNKKSVDKQIKRDFRPEDITFETRPNGRVALIHRLLKGRTQQ